MKNNVIPPYVLVFLMILVIILIVSVKVNLSQR